MSVPSNWIRDLCLAPEAWDFGSASHHSIRHTPLKTPDDLKRLWIFLFAGSFLKEPRFWDNTSHGLDSLKHTVLSILLTQSMNSKEDSAQQCEWPKYVPPRAAVAAVPTSEGKIFPWSPSSFPTPHFLPPAAPVEVLSRAFAELIQHSTLKVHWPLPWKTLACTTCMQGAGPGMEGETRTSLSLTHGRKTPDLDWPIVDLQVHGAVSFLKAAGRTVWSAGGLW